MKKDLKKIYEVTVQESLLGKKNFKIKYPLTCFCCLHVKLATSLRCMTLQKAYGNPKDTAFTTE